MTSLAVRPVARPGACTHPAEVNADPLPYVRRQAREQIVRSYTRTWVNADGDVFRKTDTQRCIDRAKAELLCGVLVDYFDRCSTPAALWACLVDEAVEHGHLIYNDGWCPPYERNRAWVDSLPVRNS